jgi:hypothetical protein
MSIIQPILDLHFTGYKLLLVILLFLLLIKRWRIRLMEIIELMNFICAIASLAFLTELLYNFLTDYFSSVNYVGYTFTERYFGSFWLQFWLALLPYFIGLLFFFKKVRSKIFLSLVFLILFNLPLLLVLIIYFNREYTSIWSYVSQFTPLYLLVYSVFIVFIYFIIQKISKYKEGYQAN